MEGPEAVSEYGTRPVLIHGTIVTVPTAYETPEEAA